MRAWAFLYFATTRNESNNALATRQPPGRAECGNVDTAAAQWETWSTVQRLPSAVCFGVHFGNPDDRGQSQMKQARHRASPRASPRINRLRNSPSRVQQPEDFHAMVSFLSPDQVRSYSEKCVQSAVMAVAEGLGRDSNARKFLEHSETAWSSA